MTEKISLLPDFGNPPVTGVAPSIQFDESIEQRRLVVPVKERGANFVIEFTGDRPRWFNSTASRLVALLNLPEGWDSYGAQRVDVSMFPATISLLSSIMRENILMPAIVPTPKGGIQLEWHARGIDLEVEVLSEGRFAVLYENEKEGVEREFDSDLTLLKELVAKLS